MKSRPRHRLEGGRMAVGLAVCSVPLALGFLLPAAQLLAWVARTAGRMLDAAFLRITVNRLVLAGSPGVGLSGRMAPLLFAYMVRFLEVALQTVEAGLAKIRPSMDEAARALGLGPLDVLEKVHVPMLRGSLITAMLLVFVDALKELPATLVLRPFNFNTLAVRTYELAADERLADAASASLAIVLAGIISRIIPIQHP